MKDESWSFDGLEDLPTPRWNDDELDEAYDHLWGDENTRAAWHVLTCSDGIGHAFDTHAPRVTYGVYPRPLCGRAVLPLGGIMPTAFCADCMARKAPN